MNNKTIIFIDFDKVSFGIIRSSLPKYVESRLYNSDSDTLNALKNEVVDLIVIESLFESKRPFESITSVEKFDCKNIIIASRDSDNITIKEEISRICPRAILIDLEAELIIDNINKILQLN